MREATDRELALAMPNRVLCCDEHVTIYTDNECVQSYPCKSRREGTADCGRFEGVGNPYLCLDMNKRSKQCVFRTVAAGKRMAQLYRKQMGLGLDGQPRRYGPKPKNNPMSLEKQHRS